MKGFKKSVAFARIMDDRKKKGEELNFIDRHFLSRYLCTYLLQLSSHYTVPRVHTLECTLASSCTCYVDRNSSLAC